MKALILEAERTTAEVGEVPVPQPAAGEVLVRVQAVALNPVDALYTKHPLGRTGRVVGSDFAGIVESEGNEGFPKGQRVAGFLQGASSANERPGAFADYLVCPTSLLWKIPDSVSYEEAATINLCGLTAAQAIFYRLGLKAPFSWQPLTDSETDHDLKIAPPPRRSEPLYFFIYGATTSVGLFAAQLLRRSQEASGRPLVLVGAASRGRFDLLKSEPYKYDYLVDYRDADWPEQVRQLTEGGVDYAYDCISEGSTVKMTSTTLREGANMAIVRSREAGAWQAADMALEPMYGAVWEGLGVDVQYHKFVVKTSPSKRAFAAAFYSWLSNGGQLIANPVRVMPGGLERIAPDGFALLGAGNVTARQQSRQESWMKPVSAEKLVYRLQD